jgi:RNA polymerase sigma-70 factor (ECF subfamily)
VEAHDLAHDAFQRLIQLGNANVNMLEKPEAYLQQIARNLVFDKIKTARRRSFHLHIQSDYAALEGPALEPQLEARDMLNRVEAAMQQLKPRTREVFMARRVDGLSYAEISEQTGLSFKIIEKEMARAIAHLQQLFGRG